MIRLTVFIAILVGTISSSYGQSVLRLSLKEAQDFAMLKNKDVENAYLDTLKAKKKVNETLATGLPQVSADVSYQYVPNDLPKLTFPSTVAGMPPTEIDVMEKEQTTLKITATQLIFSGSYLVGLQASKIYKELSNKTLKKTVQEVKEQVANTYYLVLLAKETKNNLERSAENLQKIINETEEIFKMGLIEDITLDQLKLTKKNIDITIQTITQNIDLSTLMLKVQMGIDIEQDIELTDNINKMLIEAQMEINNTQNTLNIEQNNDYSILITQEKLMKLNLKREKSEFLPTLSAFITYQKFYPEPAINFQPSALLGLSLHIPIFGSGSKLSKVSQARIELEKTKNSKYKVAQSIILAEKQANYELKTSIAKERLSAENLELANKIYEKTAIKFKEGLATSTELTQMQNQYLQAQSDYTNSIVDILTAKLKLDKVTGKL